MTTINNSIESYQFQMATKSRKGAWLISAILLILIAIGLYAFILQLKEGHLNTGMRDYVVWGIYIVNFVFLMGLSYAGAMLSSILILFRVPWRNPLLRFTQITSVIAGIIGPLFILLEIGRLDRIYFLFIHGRIPSPIMWDILAILTYLVGNILLLFLIFIPDFAYLRDNTDLNIPKWKKKWYKILAFNFVANEFQTKRLRNLLYVLAGLMIPTSILLASILSWIFGITLRPGWHSTIFGPYFVFAALYSGMGALIIISAVLKWRYKLQNAITDNHFKYMGIGLVVLSLAYGYFTFSEYFTIWYSSEKWDTELMNRLFDFKQYGWHWIFANYIGILIPPILIGIPWFRSNKTIVFSALIVLVALWVKRYLIVIPTLETPLFPIQDVRPEYISYTATWIEWMIVVAGAAGFIYVFNLILRFVPVSELSQNVLDKKSNSAND